MSNPFVQQVELQVLRGAHEEALRIARMGLTLFPDNFELIQLAAVCASRLRQDDCAIDLWQRLLTQRPEDADAANQLGVVLERQGQFDAAEQAYRHALSLEPRDGHILTNLGLLLENTSRTEAALAIQLEAVQCAPDSAAIRSNLAGIRSVLGNLTEAELDYRKSLSLDPNFATGWQNLAVLLADSGRVEEAEQCFRRALFIDPNHLTARTGLGLLLLALGRWLEAWPYYEDRQFKYQTAGQWHLLSPPPYAQWHGERLDGKAILVLPEQGLGDEIQFCRYVPWLKAQGARQVTLVCRPNQKALFASLAGVDTLYDLEEAAGHLDGYDYWTFLMSVPGYAGTTVDNVPPAPYLQASPLRRERQVGRVSGEACKVGLVWRGNPKHSNDADRSLPDLSTLAPLWRVPGVSFFSLQLSPFSLPPIPDDQPLTDLASYIEDMADTAALIEQLDLVISVDSSVAHLAGALGKPCWILLPAYKTDWRWMLGRSDTPWYGQTRLFRQVTRGDWATPVAAMQRALRTLVA